MAARVNTLRRKLYWRLHALLELKLPWDKGTLILFSESLISLMNQGVMNLISPWMNREGGVDRCVGRANDLRVADVALVVAGEIVAEGDAPRCAGWRF